MHLGAGATRSAGSRGPSAPGSGRERRPGQGHLGRASGRGAPEHRARDERGHGRDATTRRACHERVCVRPEAGTASRCPLRYGVRGTPASLDPITTGRSGPPPVRDGSRGGTKWTGSGPSLSASRGRRAAWRSDESESVPARSRWPRALALPAALAVPSTPRARPGPVQRAPRGPGAARRSRGAPCRSGRCPRPTELSMRIVLRPRDPAALASFIAAASSPSSPRLPQFLAPRRVRRVASARRIARSRAVRAAASSATGSGHLGVAEPPRACRVSGTSARFVARAARRRRAVAARERHARVPARARAHGFRRAIAGDVAGVVGVSSLVQRALVRRARPGARVARRAGSARRCARAAAADLLRGPEAIDDVRRHVLADPGGRGLRPDQRLGHGDDGTGHTVAVEEFAPYSQSDVLAYDKCFQLIGAGGDDRPQPAQRRWWTAAPRRAAPRRADEPTLDVEEIRALAPGASVVAYLGPNNVTGPIDTLQQIATDDTAQAVSISWGICEAFSDHAAETPIFQQMAAQGQTVFAASGDSGSSDCYGLSSTTGPSLVAAAVDDPSSQPLVTGRRWADRRPARPGAASRSGTTASRSTSRAASGARAAAASRRRSRDPSWQVAPGTPTGTAHGAHASASCPTSRSWAIRRRACSSTSRASTRRSAGPRWARRSWPRSTSSRRSRAASTRSASSTPSCTRWDGTAATSTTSPGQQRHRPVDPGRAHEYFAATGYDMASGLGSPDPATFLPALCDGPATATASPATASATSSWALSFHTGSTAYPVGATVTSTAPPGTVLPSDAVGVARAHLVGSHAPTAASCSTRHSSATANVATLTLADGASAVRRRRQSPRLGVTNPPPSGSAAVTSTDSVDHLSAIAPLALERADAVGPATSTVTVSAPAHRPSAAPGCASPRRFATPRATRCSAPG